MAEINRVARNCSGGERGLGIELYDDVLLP